MFGWKGALIPEQTAQIAAAKQVIYDGFKTAVAAGVPKEKAGILVDEQFGAAILGDAATRGYVTACPAEKSGQEEFDFEYGGGFAKHIEAFRPTFCKVLVRYNAEGDQALNRRQAARLKRLSDYLHSESRSLFMFELLVPAEKAQLEKLKGAGPASRRRRDPSRCVGPVPYGDGRNTQRAAHPRCRLAWRLPHQFFGLKPIALTTAATLALCSAIELQCFYRPARQGHVRSRRKPTLVGLKGKSEDQPQAKQIAPAEGALGDRSLPLSGISPIR